MAYLQMSESNWRKQAFVAGMIIGLIGGMLFAAVFGTDSGLTAVSGYSIGSVVGSFVHPELKTWIKFVFLALLAAILAFAWL
jgi:hypothetical protein